jgi:predicted transcriptional regulator
MVGFAYMSELSVVRTIRVDSDMDAQIVALAEERNITVSQFIRLSIEEVIASNERHRRLRAALDAADQLGPIDLDRAEAWTRAEDRVSR